MRPDAGLHLVEDQQQAVLVAELAQRPQERRFGTHAHAALALIGSIRIAAVSGADRALDRVEIAERHLVEAVDHRAEAVEIFLAARRRRASPACGRGTRLRR